VTVVTDTSGAGGAPAADPSTDIEATADSPARAPRGAADETAFPTRDQYLEVVTAYRDGGAETCADLCVVDYLAHPGRRLPDGVTHERFEVVVNLLSLSQARRIRVRLQVPETDAVAPSIFSVYPGVEAMEREAFDLFGIRFEGHPDMTRILMPEDWEGHPLRKDYGVGRVPVQFKEAPGPR
jgi:NADH-quinone oxidoreductase subunit C